MPVIYCMCQITAMHPKKMVLDGSLPLDNQVYNAPNRFGIMGPEDLKVGRPSEYCRPVILRRRMQVKHAGTRQVVLNYHLPNQWFREGTKEYNEDIKKLSTAKTHYPYVDVLECPHCGAIVILEG